MARVGLFVLACALPSAGHAQLQARNLDHAVGELVRTLVNEGRLSGQKVYVGADDFFEEENELRPPLSKILRTMCLRALTDRQVEVALVQAEAVQVLHGRWRRESETNLHLTLFIADPPRDQEEPVATRSADALVPVQGLHGEDVEPTLRHWGNRVTRRLERDLPGSGKYRLHLSPLSVHDKALPETFSPYLLGRWLPAFTGSGRFALVGSAQSADGVLHGEVFAAGEHIEVTLRILDEGNPVASDHVGLRKSLFPPSMVTAGASEASRIREVFPDCDVCPEIVVVPSGSYEMGSPRWEGEGSRGDDEGPLQEVTIAESLVVGKYEVTVGEFGGFVEETGYSAGEGCHTYEGGKWETRSGRSWMSPGFGQTERHPVVCVSWGDAKAYVGWLSRKTGQRYRLLSESEWEYVARAGTSSPFHFGGTVSTEQANYNGHDTYGSGLKGPFRGKTVAVGTFPANAFGLYDVHGNVWEWVEDCWHGDYKGAPSDGSAWVRGGDCERRVVRGGSWSDIPGYLRSAIRGRGSTESRFVNIGFRVARTLTP